VNREYGDDGARVGEAKLTYTPEFDSEKCGDISIGLDVIEVARIQRTLDDFGDRFLRRVFTEKELEGFRTRVNELAGRFAVKEATSKALGTGIRGIRWKEMEVLTNRRGKPVLVLHGFAKDRASALGLTDFSVSITHSRTEALAIVVGVKRNMNDRRELEGGGKHTNY
jgi:holo-[acyl-carrier protein] synthase